MSSELPLLQKYRRDRLALLGYVLKSAALKKVVMPPGCSTLEDVELDQLSVDYVLACATQGEVLDLGEAQKRYHDEIDIPPSAQTDFGEVFFLTTHVDSSGPPPSRPVPPIDLGPIPQWSFTQSLLDTDLQTPLDHNGEQIDGVRQINGAKRSFGVRSDLEALLPPLGTGLTEDDLRECAYELLVACVAGAGVALTPKDEKKKRKMSLKRRFSKRLSKKVEQTREPGVAGLLSLIRAQMEISEKSDCRTRAALLKIVSANSRMQISKLLLPLELLVTLSLIEFQNKREYQRWEKRQLDMLEEGLLLHPYLKLNGFEMEASKLKTIVSRLEEAQRMDAPMGPAQHVEGMRMLRGAAYVLASRLGPGDVDDCCHWADGFPLNVRLYEQLLNSIFDILDETSLIDEVDEVLELLRASTWTVLGINHTLHDICYSWVFFRQFVYTKEEDFLHVADQQLRAVVEDFKKGSRSNECLSVSEESDGGRLEQELGTERAYLICVLHSIKSWIDKRFLDYHLEFPKGRQGLMDVLLSISMLCTMPLSALDGEEQIGDSNPQDAGVLKQAQEYIVSSVQSAYARVRVKVDAQADVAGSEHVLALLAREVLELAQAEAKEYVPVLKIFEPHAGAVSGSLLHSLYRKELKPFLDGVSNLTDDVRAVLPVADSLEMFLMENVQDAVGRDVLEELICHGGEEVEANGAAGSIRQIVCYEVDVISNTLVLRWVNSQVGMLSNWLERTLHLETWEAVSAEKHHAASVIEAFRIVEEAVDQFFNVNLPVKFPLLKGLVSAIDTGLQNYVARVSAEIGAREDLLPIPPPLTRYKKDVVQKLQDAQRSSMILPMLRFSQSMPAKRWDARQPDDKRMAQIKGFSVQSLCLRLNSLQYVLQQLQAVETRTCERWSERSAQDAAHPGRRKKRQKEEVQGLNGSSSSPLESSKVKLDEEVILRQFDGTRASANAGINAICSFTGYKVVFWDLKVPFIDELYYLNVSKSRIAKVIHPLEKILTRMCEVIDQALRDKLVACLLEASLEGFLHVLLEGGPGRAFTLEDGDMVEEDMNTLRDFFVADGDGLSPQIVDEAIKPLERLLALFTLETNLLVANLKAASMVNDMPDSIVRNSSMRLSLRTWSPHDSRTLLRILCHRADREASKFLKRTCKLPKTVTV